MFYQTNEKAIESNTVDTRYKVFDEMSRRTTMKKDNIIFIT